MDSQGLRCHTKSGKAVHLVKERGADVMSSRESRICVYSLERRKLQGEKRVSIVSGSVLCAYIIQRGYPRTASSTWTPGVKPRESNGMGLGEYGLLTSTLPVQADKLRKLPKSCRFGTSCLPAPLSQTLYLIRLSPCGIV